MTTEQHKKIVDEAYRVSKSNVEGKYYRDIRYGFILGAEFTLNNLSEPSENIGQLEKISIERCKYELFVEKYFGLNSNNTTEDTVITTDFGQLCNLLAMFKNENIGQLAEIANQYALSVMPTCSLQELSIISDAVIYGYGLRIKNIGQPKNDLTLVTSND